jgi:hypothetical protein
MLVNWGITAKSCILLIYYLNYFQFFQDCFIMTKKLTNLMQIFYINVILKMKIYYFGM